MIKFEVEVSAQRIADMFVGAIEGGSAYWCSSFQMNTKAKKGYDNKKCKYPWYSDPEFWEKFMVDDWGVVALDQENDSEAHDVTAISLTNGLRIMQEKSPRHFADMMSENDDADTADCFFQCVVLGEYIYG